MQIQNIPKGWILLDIEQKKVDNEWITSEVAIIERSGCQHEKRPTRESFQTSLLTKLSQAKVILGHNIRRHDLPKICQCSSKKLPPDLNQKICDTLELSSLFLVGNPTHKLNKLYREELGFSDPVEDAWESFELYQKIEKLADSLPLLVCYWANKLLLEGSPQDLILKEGEDDWTELKLKMPDADIEALQKYIKRLDKHPKESNLGAVIFLHWLYHINNPLAHRPKWAESTFTTFRDAESATFPLLSQDYFWDINLDKDLKFFFGEDYSFRDNQLDLVKAFLSKEITPLGILPTGGGKSLTFQLPALILSKYYRNLSVIISPLQALMIDQVQNLQEQLKSIQPDYVDRIALLSATQSIKEQKEVIDDLWQGKVDIVYLSPERLRQPTIQRVLKHRSPALWILDEAHTLSQWGHDFRPDFMRIAGIIKGIYGEKSHDCRWGFVTATATDKVIQDLQDKVNRLNLGSENTKLFTGELQIFPKNKEYFQWRKEITTYVENLSERGRRDRLLEILQTEHSLHPDGVAIVYARFRKETEEYAKIIRSCDDGNGNQLRVEAFHSKISASKKQEILRKFKNKELDIVVATSAFGMGIDREGIHTVIHIAPPATPEAYLQEVGRLARKHGETGKAYLFQDNEDFDRIFAQENKSQISYQGLRGCWDVVRNKLNKENGETWISTLDLEKYIGADDSEILSTQTRTVLYHLETGDLIREKESCPCVLFVKLMNDFNLLKDLPAAVKHKEILQYIADLGIRKKFEFINLDVREVSLATSIQPLKLINSIRYLVKHKILIWRYEISFKFAKSKTTTEIQKLWDSTRIFLNDLQDRSDSVEDQNIVKINSIDSLEREINANNKNVKFKLDNGLKLLLKLKLAKIEKKGHYGINLCLQGNQSLSNWTKTSFLVCEKSFDEIVIVEKVITQIFNDKKWSLKENQIIDLAEIEKRLANTKISGTNSMNILSLMQKLGLIILGQGDSSYERLYRIVRYTEKSQKDDKSRSKNWSESIYTPLRDHYIQRCQRVYAIREVLKRSSEETRIEVLKDYFLTPLDNFKSKYFPDIDISKPPIVSDILNNISPAQKEIVTDDTSRALLILAGPGSGKTRTIVYRVAHLIAIGGVPPSKILVLSHTRTAAAEVRKRLYQILGSRGSQVDALTFHALAIKLTGLRHNDAPLDIKKDARFNWLLQQAIAYIEENSTEYQYILIDEYQDINELQYQIVKLLGNFTRDSDQEEQQDSFLVAVGDPNQNLFEFAGSSNKFINEFRKDWAIQEQPERCLFANYRSLPAIVDFTNTFINQTIPNNQINQTGEKIYAHRNDGKGEILWGEYSHLYHASQWIAKKIRDLIVNKGIKPTEIAVLAHRWNDLKFVQHFLQEFDIPYQFYDNSDNLQPANSLIGQRVLQHLRQDPSLKIDRPIERMEEIRSELGYSDCDVAWKSLLSSLQEIQKVTQDEICYILEEAKTVRYEEVVLSTFHSAKGSEFSHVLVIEGGDRLTGDNSYESCVRKLYVGFTRAKDSLTILFNQRNISSDPASIALSILQNSSINSGVSKINIPLSAMDNKLIRYKDVLDIKDLWLSHRHTLLGQDRIDYYAKKWGELRLSNDSFQCSHIDEYCSPFMSGVIAVLSNSGKDKLRSHQNKRIIATGYTIFRVERDDEFIPSDIRDKFINDHHYVVLPCLEIEESFI